MFIEQSCRILPFARPAEPVFTLLSSSSLVHFGAICPLLHAESGLLVSPHPAPDGNRFEPHLGLEVAHLFGEVVDSRRCLWRASRRDPILLDRNETCSRKSEYCAAARIDARSRRATPENPLTPFF